METKMSSYSECSTSLPTPPNIGDFYLEPMFGVMNYYSRDRVWRDNPIVEENGDEFEIVRLEVIPTPEEFKLEMQ